MCRATTAPARKEVLPASNSPFKLPLLVVLLALPFLPSICWFNRGYTQWFHGCAIIYALTKDPWWCKFVAIQGLTVNMGWYASLAKDLYYNQRFGHILYYNMPAILSTHMLDEDLNVLYSYQATAAKLIAHLLDTCAHPILAYHFWRTCWARGRWHDIVTWSTLGSTYFVSRLWSILHSYLNQGVWRLHYVGYDVYSIPSNDLTLWYPAYIAEGVFYVLAIGYRLYYERQTNNIIRKLT